MRRWGTEQIEFIKSPSFHNITYLLFLRRASKARPLLPLQAVGHYVPLNTCHLPRLVPPVSPGGSVPSFSPVSGIVPNRSPSFNSWGYF